MYILCEWNRVHPLCTRVWATCSTEGVSWRRKSLQCKRHTSISLMKWATYDISCIPPPTVGVLCPLAVSKRITRHLCPKYDTWGEKDFVSWNSCNHKILGDVKQYCDTISKLNRSVPKQAYMHIYIYIVCMLLNSIKCYVEFMYTTSVHGSFIWSEIKKKWNVVVNTNTSRWEFPLEVLNLTWMSWALLRHYCDERSNQKRSIVVAAVLSTRNVTAPETGLFSVI